MCEDTYGSGSSFPEARNSQALGTEHNSQYQYFMWDPTSADPDFSSTQFPTAMASTPLYVPPQSMSRISYKITATTPEHKLTFGIRTVTLPALLRAHKPLALYIIFHHSRFQNRFDIPLVPAPSVHILYLHCLLIRRTITGMHQYLSRQEELMALISLPLVPRTSMVQVSIPMRTVSLGLRQLAEHLKKGDEIKTSWESMCATSVCKILLQLITCGVCFPDVQHKYVSLT